VMAFHHLWILSFKYCSKTCDCFNPLFLKQIKNRNIWNSRWKHIMVTPFRMSYYITFQGCACLNVSHLNFLKNFHNIFVYYVRILPEQDIWKEIISYHFIKWKIVIYLWKKCSVFIHSKTQIYSKNNLNDF